MDEPRNDDNAEWRILGIAILDWWKPTLWFCAGALFVLLIIGGVALLDQ